MKVLNYLHTVGPSVFYTDDFKSVLETHLEYLNNHSSTTTLSIEPDVLYKYEFDLHGLLFHYKIPQYMHWVIMRMNGLYSFTQIPNDLLVMKIPNEDTLDLVRQVYQTTKS